MKQAGAFIKNYYHPNATYAINPSMNIHLINILNKRLETCMHNALKTPFLYFLLFFSALIVLLFPFYLKDNGNKLDRLLIVSLLLGIIASLIYAIYITGGFNV